MPGFPLIYIYCTYLSLRNSKKYTNYKKIIDKLFVAWYYRSINKFILFWIVTEGYFLTEKAIPLDIHIRFVEGVVFYFI